MLYPSDEDLDKLAQLVADARKVAIFGGDGCRDARSEVLQLAYPGRQTIALCDEVAISKPFLPHSGIFYFIYPI